uniref:Uncharacterized protein n=1 Tax=Mycobacterium marinum DL240490 TaxID=459420 RepID=B6CLQ2_MYCMR|nr:conserved hypothetical protein [Mycobacterium marinum DL240490]
MNAIQHVGHDDRCRGQMMGRRRHRFEPQHVNTTIRQTNQSIGILESQETPAGVGMAAQARRPTVGQPARACGA